MLCPFCTHEDTAVVDSRLSEEGVRRRRECIKCRRRFTTYERAEIDLLVLKRDGRKEEFQREKVLRGLQRACEKRVPEEHIEAMADRIERKLHAMKKPEVRTTTIGNLVLRELMRVDKVAYMRFASVYKSFDNVKHFERELKVIKEV